MQTKLIGFAVLSLTLTSGCALRSKSTLLTPGTKPPPIVAAGWINGPGPEPEALEGKVVVLDIWAFW